MITTGKMAFTLDGIVESNIRDKQGVSHLLYEIEQMLWSIWKYGNVERAGSETWDIHLSNALMNDVLCHARTIIEVAAGEYSKHKMEEGALLRDFKKVDNAALRSLKGNISARISHLGESRKKGEKEWDAKGNLGPVIAVALEMIDHIYPEEHSNRALAREWIDSPMSMTSSTSGL